MTDQGETMLPEIDRFIDANFADIWFQRDGVPPKLLQDAGGELPSISWDDFAEPLPSDVFKELLRSSLQRAHNPYAPAHGFTHASRDVSYLTDALEALERILKITLPMRFKQIVIIAMARHDWEHPGATFFELHDEETLTGLKVPGKLPRSIEKYAVEYLTSIYADDAACQDGLTIADRVVQLYIIWSTTNPTNAERMGRLGMNPVEPKKIIGRLAQAVDVTSTTDDTTNVKFEAGLIGIEEFPEPPPANSVTYAESRERFIGIVTKRYRLTDEAVYELVALLGGRIESLVQAVGWHLSLERIQGFVYRLRGGTGELATDVVGAQLSTAFALVGHELAT